MKKKDKEELKKDLEEMREVDKKILLGGIKASQNIVYHTYIELEEYRKTIAENIESTRETNLHEK